MRLLALDTASGQCSVALLIDGELRERAERTAREHAQLLLPMVDELLAEAGARLASLDGIAFGRGPGSFTGVRIAAAVTQGLAAGADLPVLPVSDLRALAEQARTHFIASGGWLLAAMDARMGELYWGLFRDEGVPLAEAVGGERLSRPEGLQQALAGLLPTGARLAAGAGMGLGAYPALADALGFTAASSLPQAEPHAACIARLAAADLSRGAAWQDAAMAQPVYLRDQVVQTRPL